VRDARVHLLTQAQPLRPVRRLLAFGEQRGEVRALVGSGLREGGVGQLAYFGLMPEALGKRLGYFFLYQAIANAWSHPITKLLVNTCTLDHPRALPLYQRLGFVAYSREDRYIELP